MRRAAAFLALAAGCAGCAGPNPTQLRISLMTVYAPRVTVYAGGPTNAASAAGLSARGEGETMTVAPTQRGTLVMFDNQFSFPNGSGTAASNSVLSGIDIPLVK